MYTEVLCLLFLVGLAKSKITLDLDMFWKEFKKVSCKDYCDEEEVERKKIWEDNVMSTFGHNLEYDMGLKLFRMGINEYADMTTEEFIREMTGFRGFVGRNRNRRPNRGFQADSSLPDSIDWRDRGYVTEVKNQGSCGSCYAFSSTGALEGQYRNRTGNLITLSNQNIVDCSGSEGNNGCNGGLMTQSFEWIRENGGIDLEESYPYREEEGSCRFGGGDSGVQVASYVELEPNEAALQRAVVTVGPIAVGIIAYVRSFQLYKGGIYDDQECSRKRMDHAVLVVGYGTEDGNDYWLLKNSWGTTWGENGYMRLARNQGNLCGIASAASYPILR